MPSLVVPASLVYLAIFALALSTVLFIPSRILLIRFSTSPICVPNLALILVICRCTALATLSSLPLAFVIALLRRSRSGRCALRNSAPFLTLSTSAVNTPPELVPCDVYASTSLSSNIRRFSA